MMWYQEADASAAGGRGTDNRRTSHRESVGPLVIREYMPPQRQSAGPPAGEKNSLVDNSLSQGNGLHPRMESASALTTTGEEKFGEPVMQSPASASEDEVGKSGETLPKGVSPQTYRDNVVKFDEQERELLILEVDHLFERCQSLQKEKDNAQEHLDYLKREKERIDELCKTQGEQIIIVTTREEELIQKYQKEVAELTDKHTSSFEQLQISHSNMLENVTKEWTTKCELLENQLQSVEDAHESALQAREADKLSAVGERDKKMDLLKSEAAEASKKSLSFEIEVSTLKVDIETLTHEKGALRDECLRTKTTLDNRSTELKTARVEVQTLREEVQSVKSMANLLESRNASLQSDNARLLSNLEGMEKERTAMVKELAEVRAQKKASKDRESILARDIARTQEQLDEKVTDFIRLQSDFEKFKKEHDDRKIKEKLAESEQQNQLLKAQLQTAEQTREMKQSDISHLKQEVDSLKKDLSERQEFKSSEVSASCSRTDSVTLGARDTVTSATGPVFSTLRVAGGKKGRAKGQNGVQPTEGFSKIRKERDELKEELEKLKIEKAQLRRKYVTATKSESVWQEEKKAMQSQVYKLEDNLQNLQMALQSQADEMVEQHKNVVRRMEEERKAAILEKVTQIEEKIAELNLKEEELSNELSLRKQMQEQYEDRTIALERELVERGQNYENEALVNKNLLAVETARACEMQQELDELRIFAEDQENAVHDVRIELEAQHKEDLCTLENNLRNHFQTQMERKLELQRIELEVEMNECHQMEIQRLLDEKNSWKNVAYATTPSDAAVAYPPLGQMGTPLDQLATPLGEPGRVGTPLNVQPIMTSSIAEEEPGFMQMHEEEMTSVDLESNAVVGRLQRSIDTLGAKLSCVELESEDLREQCESLKGSVDGNGELMAKIKNLEQQVRDLSVGKGEFSAGDKSDVVSDTKNDRTVRFSASTGKPTPDTGFQGKDTSADPKDKVSQEEISEGYSILKELRRALTAKNEKPAEDATGSPFELHEAIVDDSSADSSLVPTLTQTGQSGLFSPQHSAILRAPQGFREQRSRSALAVRDGSSTQKALENVFSPRGSVDPLSQTIATIGGPNIGGFTLANAPPLQKSLDAHQDRPESARSSNVSWKGPQGTIVPRLGVPFLPRVGNFTKPIIRSARSPVSSERSPNMFPFGAVQKGGAGVPQSANIVPQQNVYLVPQQDTNGNVGSQQPQKNSVASEEPMQENQNPMPVMEKKGKPVLAVPMINPNPVFKFGKEGPSTGPTPTILGNITNTASSTPGGFSISSRRLSPMISARSGINTAQFREKTAQFRARSPLYTAAQSRQ